MSEKKERLVFLAKHGPEHPEKATLPFAMALGAMASDMDAVVVLQSDGGMLALRGVAKHVLPQGMAPLLELLDLFVADGGKLLVCSACLTARKIGDGELIEGVEKASVARLAKEFSEATNVISY